MKLKSHLQYERDFCNMMKTAGFHTERVAASGRRKGSVCDAVLFTSGNCFLVEVKSTRHKFFDLSGGLHGIVEACEGRNVLPLIAVYFKSHHSSEGPGRWVLKVINKELRRIDKHDRSEEI